MKKLLLQPINRTVTVQTKTSLLDALLSSELEVPMACKGRGICATCHVHVEQGHDRLSPKTERECRSLAIITSANENSRLSCQARVLGEGVVVKLPEGMYIERAEDLLDLVGTRAERDILHPINGSVLIAKGKVIIRSRIEELKRLNFEMEQLTLSRD
jgi:ferredoxin